MANEEHVRILKQGVEVWNRWREENPGVVPDLRVADLSEANLQDANLSKARISGVDLSEANLIHADLREAVLREARLWNTELREADLYAAELNGADLSGANLSKTVLRRSKLFRTNLSGANLSGTDLHRAALYFTLFANVDLSNAGDLESVVHLGPSTIGIDTLVRSRGKIPAAFLRGAGVPEELITSIPRVFTGKAIQYASCFISYSSKDEDFARRLHADLQARGVRVWFAPEDIQGGRKLHEQIPEAIRLYDKLLLVLSENSMQSEWVKTEIYHARQNEIKDNCRKLFPIGLEEFGKIRVWSAFDADVGKDMAREVREYYVPDFSNWKDHAAYQAAFERLMRDLNLEG